MASGAGLQVDAIQTLRRNRKLLKGEGNSKYKNFDRKSYVVKTMRPQVAFKDASPELLVAIKDRIIEQNIESRRRDTFVFSISMISAILLMVLLGKVYLYLFF